MFAAGQGDGRGQGLDRLSAPGLPPRVTGGHGGRVPRIAAMALAGEVEAWSSGTDLERDVLAHREFEPIIDGEPRCLDPRLFRAEPTGLAGLLGR